MKKLQLKKNVIATLANEQLAQVVGGQPDYTQLCFTGLVACITRALKCETTVKP